MNSHCENCHGVVEEFGSRYCWECEGKEQAKAQSRRSTKPARKTVKNSICVQLDIECAMFTCGLNETTNTLGISLDEFKSMEEWKEKFDRMLIRRGWEEINGLPFCKHCAARYRARKARLDKQGNKVES